MFFPHFPLILLCFCLFLSISYAHDKSNETPECDCASANKNSHDNIPTKSCKSSPPHSSSKEVPTKPGNSAHNSREVPTKSGKSSPAQDKSRETPTKSGKSSPSQDKSRETPTKSGKSSPAQDKSRETPTKPCNSSTTHNNGKKNPIKTDNSSTTQNKGEKNPNKTDNSSPAQNNSQGVPAKPSNSSPDHNSSNEIPTKPGNSSPAQNNSQEVPTKPGNSSPARNNSEEVPTKPGNSSPDQYSSDKVSTEPGNSSPVHKNSPEVPAKPGNSSPDNNNSQDTSTRHNNYIGNFQKVYAFGDSYTDTGNANLVGGLSVSFTHTSSVSAKSNSGLCDGHLVVDFLCDALKLPHLPPFQSTSANFTTGANFAIAGSTILPKEDFSTKKITSLFWKGIPLTFQTQIDWFNKLKQQMGCSGKSCNGELENSLFWIGSVGVSDYARIQGSSLSTHWLTQQSVHQVSRLIEAVLESGAKYIVVQGLPPIGCLPLHISLCPVKAALDHMGCAAAVNAAVMIHNQILQRSLERFRGLYPNCHILYADYWNAYLTIKMNLKKYQFEEAFKPCCGVAGGPLNFNLHTLCGSPGTIKCNDPSKFISWDGIHLTEAMNRKVTDLFLNQGFCQPSFSELVKSKSGM